MYGLLDAASLHLASGFIWCGQQDNFSAAMLGVRPVIAGQLFVHLAYARAS